MTAAGDPEGGRADVEADVEGWVGNDRFAIASMASESWGEPATLIGVGGSDRASVRS